MLTAEITLTGGQVARMLINDTEEASYCIRELIEEAPDDFAVEIAEYSNDPEEIAQFFEAMAKQIRDAFADDVRS